MNEYSKSKQKDFHSINRECNELAYLRFLKIRLLLIEKISAENYKINILFETNKAEFTQIDIQEVFDNINLYCNKNNLKLTEKKDVAMLFDATAISRYLKTLENMVVELRTKINILTPSYQDVPFPDLHVGIDEVFDDYPAFQLYKEFFCSSK